MNAERSTSQLSSSERGATTKTVVLRDDKGRVRWKLPGNTDEENEQLGIRNIQGLFLERFPDFNELFPRNENGDIFTDKKDEAKEFILQRVGTYKKFVREISSTPLKRETTSYFEGYFRIALLKAFSIWGLVIDIPKPAPEGWKMKEDLMRELGIQKRTARNIADRYREEFPQWFGEFRSGRGSEEEFYSPELTTLIIQEAGERAPEGWGTRGKLIKSTGISHKAIENIASKHGQEHPEWFRKYRSPTGVSEHYSPELVALIIQEAGHRANEGWKTNFALSRQLRTGQNTIEDITDRYRIDHPEWFQMFRPRSGQNTEHYSPVLVNLISQEVKALAPTGWATKTAISKQIKIQPEVVKTIADRFQLDHPDWFRNYRSRGSRAIEYYSPELVALIIEGAGEETPEGWKTTSYIAKEFGVNLKTVRRYANRYRMEHSEWFQRYRATSNIEYCAPELINLIIQACGDSAPAGWETAGKMMTHLKKAHKTIVDIAERYRSEYPEWFKRFRSAGGITEHYNPVLIQEIKRIVSREESKNQATISPEEAMEQLRRLLEG